MLMIDCPTGVLSRFDINNLGGGHRNTYISLYALNKLAVIISVATGKCSGNINGIYLNQGMKDEKPCYKNSQSELLAQLL